MQKQHNLRIAADCIATAITSLLFVSLLAWAFSSMAQGRESTGATIPLDCMNKVTILAFRKPCRVDSKNPDLAHCDDVVISFHCIKYSNAKTP